MNLSKLGNRIRSQREKRRLTQAQLANTLHISAQAVSKWERGENAPDITMLQPLSSILERSIEWILSGSDENNNTFEATLLCTSHRGFAKKSAKIEPESIALWINGIFHTMTEVVLSKNGVPIKYTGDGFLAYFSGNNQVQRAIDAAKTCIETVGDKDLLITLNKGNIYLGSIGHHEYSQADILGKTVNAVFLMNRWATDNCSHQLVLSKNISEELTNSNCSTLFEGDETVPALCVLK